MILKTCTKCGVAKPLSEFPKSARRTGERAARGGLDVAAECNYCRAERRKPGTHAERAARGALAAAGLKRCGTCEATKPRAEFHVRKASKDGLAYSCIACVVARCKAWKSNNPDAFKQWAAENSEHRSVYGKEWRAANREYLKASMASWAKANSHLIRAKGARRNAMKLRATVAWADAAAIAAIYAEATRLTKETGVNYEVDHYYPLQGKLVCGLHCEANLQIITEFENIQKLNRMPEEHYEARRNCSSRSGHGTRRARVRLERDGAPEPQGSEHGRNAEPAG